MSIVRLDPFVHLVAAAKVSKCGWCKHRFELTDKRRTYCSRLCANRALAKKAHDLAPARREARKITCAREGCSVRFLRHGQQRYCSTTCSAKERWRKVRRRPALRSRRTDPTVGEGSAPTCPKHPKTALSFGTHPLTGTTLEFCGKCNECRPLPIRGVRRYDQRAELDGEMDKKVAHAQRRIPAKRSEFVGDAFRQQTHKRGKSAA